MKPSLNSEKRRRELNRINRENNKLLKRLQGKKSNYNVARWEYERKEKEKILQNISSYSHCQEYRHKSQPKQRDQDIKQSANSTQMNFTKGLKFPSFNGVKSIGNESGDDQTINKDQLRRIDEEGKQATERDDYESRRILKQIKKGETIPNWRNLSFTKSNTLIWENNKDWWERLFSRDFKRQASYVYYCIFNWKGKILYNANTN